MATSATSPPAKRTERPGERWSGFAQSANWPKTAAFFSSSHLGDERWVELRVPAEYENAYRTLTRGQRLPIGMRVLLTFRATQGAPVQFHFTAEKLEAGWSYRVLSVDGLDENVETSLCQRCHAEGRSDGLFGIPVSL